MVTCYMYPRADESIIMKTWEWHSRAAKHIIFKNTYANTCNTSEIPCEREIPFYSKLLFVVVCVYMCVFDCRCKHIKRLGEHSSRQNNTEQTTEKLREHSQHKYIEKHMNNGIHTRYPAHECDIYLFESGRGLAILYFCCLCVSRSFSVVFSVLFCLCLFSPSLFKQLHLQSNKYT